MAKTIITRQQVISDLRDLFGLPVEGNRKDNNGRSFCSEKKLDTAFFCIDKRHFERSEVLQKLGEYFSDKMIDGGMCCVNNFTFVTTIFWIKLAKKEG